MMDLLFPVAPLGRFLCLAKEGGKLEFYQQNQCAAND